MSTKAALRTHGSRRLPRGDRPGARPPDLQQLARGLSHEILNPLAGIKAALGILRETEQLSRHGREIEGEIDLEIEQIERVIRQFLELAFCPEPNLVALQVDALLESIRDMTGADAEGVAIQVSAPKNLRVRADLAMLQKALAELVDNGVRHGARRTVLTARPAGSSVAIRVVNDGTPVDREIAGRIFEPFFSTLPRRVGLGLPIAQRWLAAMNGTIRLLPEKDGFEIRLPKGR